MNKKEKNNASWEPLEPVLNVSTGRIDSALSDDFVMDDKGRIKQKVGKDLFVDIESGNAEIIEPLFFGKNGKGK